MQETWQLDDLYPSYESDAFQQDFKRLGLLMDEFAQLHPEDQLEDVKSVIDLFERHVVLARRIGSFIRLNLSTNTTDEESLKYSNLFDNLVIEKDFEKHYTRLYRFLGESTVDVSQDEVLEAYSFYFDELRHKQDYLLSDEVESALGLMSLSGGDGWNQMFHHLTSTTEVEFDGEMRTLTEIRNLAYDKDADIRKRAYEAEMELYQNIKDPIAFALNNIKFQAINTSKLRGYDSVIDQTLQQARMKPETLESMLEAIREGFPMFRRYMQAKAKFLGHENGLPFYDLFAPIGETSETFTVAESKTYLIEQFSKFSDTLANLTDEMYEKRHVDFPPRKGKRGGAFCSNLPFINQSRIMMNFDGSLSNVITMAHELGHAYHGHIIQTHRPLNWSYSMPVAETASTFNENILMESLLSNADDLETELFLLESQLSDLNQILVDIYSRYLFESSVFDQRQTNFIFAGELEEIMLNAQRETYGDGLDSEVLHPYMWVNKLHYYFVGLNFYNFPYSFGALLARGLYQQYKDQPEGFVDRYHEFLYATTTSTIEDAALKMGIDVTDKAYWESAVQSIEPLVDRFEELVDLLK